MTNFEQCDEAGAKLLRCYQALGEVAVIVRTKGNQVSIILPNIDRASVATMLRSAADNVEHQERQA